MKKIALVPIVMLAAFVVWHQSASVTRTNKEAARQPLAPSAPRHGSQPPATIPAADIPIEEKVQALATSGTPDQYLDAYRFISRCLELERNKELSDSELKITRSNGGTEVGLETTSVSEPELAKLRASCATMSGRTRMDRYSLLKYAMDHHASGAIATYIVDGPNGEPNALRDDAGNPVVTEWRNDALTRLKTEAEAGYIDALMFWTNGSSMLNVESDMADTYMFYLASNKILGAINNDQGLYSKEVLQFASESLSQQQTDEAAANAEKIYLKWENRLKLTKKNL